MPTARRRHFVTESDDLASALDSAAQFWPGLSRPQLIVRLALEGRRAVEESRTERRLRRIEAIRAASGCLTGVYHPEYLEELRKDWPQ